MRSLWGASQCFNFSQRSPKYLISPYDAKESKVLVADSFDKRGLLEMQNDGMDVIYDPVLEGEDLQAAIKEMEPEVLLVRQTEVNQAVIEASSNLQLVVRAGTSYDTIDH